MKRELKIRALFVDLRRFIGERTDVLVHADSLETACLTGEPFRYVRPPRPAGRTARYIDKATQYLVAFPGPHRQIDICRKCNIPKGSTVQVFSSDRFIKIEAGLIVINPDCPIPADLAPLYKYQDAIIAILRKLQPCKTSEVASELGLSYKAARKELESGYFHASPDGFWLPLKPDEEEDDES